MTNHNNEIEKWTNSIDYHSLFAEAVLHRNSAKCSHIIFVEGPSDKRRFSSHFIDSCAWIICNGKENAIRVFKEKDIDIIESCIFLLDSDFDKELSRKIISDKVFYSNYYDFESDFFSTQTIKKIINCISPSFCTDLSDSNFIDFEKMIDYLSEVTTAKYLNKMEDWCIKFEVPVHPFVFKNEIDIKKISKGVHRQQFEY